MISPPWSAEDPTSQAALLHDWPSLRLAYQLFCIDDRLFPAIDQFATSLNIHQFDAL